MVLARECHNSSPAMPTAVNSRMTSRLTKSKTICLHLRISAASPHSSRYLLYELDMHVSVLLCVTAPPASLSRHLTVVDALYGHVTTRTLSSFSVLAFWVQRTGRRDPATGAGVDESRGRYFRRLHGRRRRYFWCGRSVRNETENRKPFDDARAGTKKAGIL